MELIQISWASARVNANLTQDEVADKMGISKQTIVNWEKGRSEPSISQSRALSQLYNFPLNNIKTAT